jgi:hypothetical protein
MNSRPVYLTARRRPRRRCCHGCWWLHRRRDRTPPAACSPSFCVTDLMSPSYSPQAGDNVLIRRQPADGGTVGSLAEQGCPGPLARQPNKMRRPATVRAGANAVRFQRYPPSLILQSPPPLSRPRSSGAAAPRLAPHLALAARAMLTRTRMRGRGQRTAITGKGRGAEAAAARRPEAARPSAPRCRCAEARVPLVAEASAPLRSPPSFTLRAARGRSAARARARRGPLRHGPVPRIAARSPLSPSASL